MNRTLMTIVSTLALSGCLGSASSASKSWEISDLKVEKDSLNYVVVSGKITRTSTLTPLAPSAEVTFYQDEYKTTILVDTETIGSDVKAKDGAQVFKISHYKVWLLPSTGGYSKVCATIKASDTNYSDATQAGCL